MKNLNICIDIDGTLTEPYYWLDTANKYFNLNITEKDVTNYNISEVLNIKNEAYLKFYEEKKFEIHSKEKLRNNAQNIIKLLYKINNIYFVTARDKSLELFTNLYLKSYKIPFDDVFVLGTTNKVPIAKKLNCDIFIEDSYDNAIQLSENGFKVLLMDTNYNRYPLKHNIIRVYGWNGIFHIINNILKQEKVI